MKVRLLSRVPSSIDSLFSVVKSVRQQNERHEKQGCAGKSSNNGLKTPKFLRVKDSKGKPIRGFWIRGKQFYARLFIDNGSGQKIYRRVPLDAKTVQDARRELEQLKFLGKTSNLSIRQSQPFNSFRDHYLDSIANMKRKRTYDSENQHLKQWSAFFGNLPIHQISRGVTPFFEPHVMRDLVLGFHFHCSV